MTNDRMSAPSDNCLVRAADALVADHKGGEWGPWPPEVWTQLHALIRQVPGQLAHMGMHYRCEKCEFEWLVYLTIGLEGPEPLKANDLALPVPFVISCPRWGEPPEYTPCGGSMLHVDWSRDQHFAPLVLIPDNAPRFVMPTTAVGEDAPCGHLETPVPALIRGRRGDSNGRRS